MSVLPEARVQASIFITASSVWLLDSHACRSESEELRRYDRLNHEMRHPSRSPEWARGAPGRNKLPASSHPDLAEICRASAQRRGQASLPSLELRTVNGLQVDRPAEP